MPAMLFAPRRTGAAIGEHRSRLICPRLRVARRGSTYEANKALLRAYDFLESGSVNDEGRVFAATLFTDSARLQGRAVRAGDLPRPRRQPQRSKATGDRASRRGCDACSATTTTLAPRSTPPRSRSPDARRPGDDYLETERVVDTDFAAAYLLEAIADRAIGIRSNAIEFAIGADPSVEPLARRIERGEYDTVVIAHTGRARSSRISAR